MIYCDYRFEITEQGLLFSDKPMQIMIGDKPTPDETYMVRISQTSFTPGDKFTLELDEIGRMFFRKDGPVQLNLEL